MLAVRWRVGVLSQRLVQSGITNENVGCCIVLVSGAGSVENLQCSFLRLVVRWSSNLVWRYSL
jgi:hypothetical protein